MRQSPIMILRMRTRPSSALAATLFVAVLSSSSYSLASSTTSTALASASISTSASVPGCPLVSTGLTNCGNTCYLAAQLQCAFHIPLVRSIVLNPEVQASPESPIVTQDDAADRSSSTSSATDSSEEGPAKIVESESSSVSPQSSIALQALRLLFRDMFVAAENRAGLAVSPIHLCRSLGINVQEQQDSQEFWKLLLPALQSRRLADLYQGAFEDYIIALDGSGREKRREEAFLDLSLDVIASNNGDDSSSSSSSSVLSALQTMFGTPELLSVKEGNGWRPESGADKVDAHKGCRLKPQGLPPILQVHLKRFHYDWQTDTTIKLNNPFAFPLELDLASLRAKEEEGSGTDDATLTVYDLQAIVIHAGEYGSGHYYAYVRPDIVRGDVWYRFNDHHVDQVCYQDVYVDACGGKGSFSADLPRPSGHWLERIKRVLMHRNSYGYGGRTSNAYVLQYVRRKDIPMLYESCD